MAQELTETFIRSLKAEKEDLRELNLSNAEIILDNMIEDDFLEKIPVFMYIYGGYKFTLGIREGFLLKKLVRFLFNTCDIPERERDKFIKKLNSDRAYEKKAVEKTLLILDKLDEIRKVDIFAELFKHLVVGNITLKKYERLIHIIEGVYLDDLAIVEAMYRQTNKVNVSNQTDFQLEQGEGSILIGLGLVTNRFEIKEDGNLYLHYELSEHAVDLIKYGLK